MQPKKKKRRKAHASCCFLIQRLLTFHTQEEKKKRGERPTHAVVSWFKGCLRFTPRREGKKKPLSCDTTLLPVELLSCYQCVVKFSPSAFCTISNRPLSQSLAGAYDNDNLNPVLYHLTPCTQSPDWLIPSHSCPWKTPACTPWYDQKKMQPKKKKEAKGPRKLLFPNWKAAYVSHPGGEKKKMQQKKKRRMAHACCCFLIQRLLTFHIQEGKKMQPKKKKEADGPRKLLFPSIKAAHVSLPGKKKKKHAAPPKKKRGGRPTQAVVSLFKGCLRFTPEKKKKKKAAKKKKRRKAHASCCFLIHRLLTFHTKEEKKNAQHRLLPAI